MLTSVIPKLPMRNKNATKDYYIHILGFREIEDYGDYLLVEKDSIELHFFEFKALDPKENYAQVYIRVEGIEVFYHALVAQNIPIHPNAPLQVKPWGQREFSLLDPDGTLLTFGEEV